MYIQLKKINFTACLVVNYIINGIFFRFNIKINFFNCRLLVSFCYISSFYLIDDICFCCFITCELNI